MSQADTWTQEWSDTFGPEADWIGLFEPEPLAAEFLVPLSVDTYGPKWRNRPVGMQNHPKSAILILNNWMDANMRDPYPSQVVVQELSVATGLRSDQVQNWLCNTRKRNPVIRALRINTSVL
jgi:hypothetical protein